VAWPDKLNNSRVNPLLSAALEGEAEGSIPSAALRRGLIKREAEMKWDAKYHSRPVARSLAILDDIIDYVQGRTNKSSWVAFRVALTWEAMEMLELDSRHITSRRELHRVARLYEAIKKGGGRWNRM